MYQFQFYKKYGLFIPNLFVIKDFELFTNTREISKDGVFAIYCKKSLNPKKYFHFYVDCNRNTN